MALELASLGRSDSWGATRKPGNGEQNIREKALRFSGLAAIFLLAVFRAAPRLNERLEEATLEIDV